MVWHRAFYGFKVGSTVSKGDCAYQPDSLDDIIKDTNNFWNDRDNLNTNTCIKFNADNNKDMLYTEWTYSDTVPNKKIRGTISSLWTEIPELGKGEWTAKTLDDAKQMAIDFAESVS